MRSLIEQSRDLHNERGFSMTKTIGFFGGGNMGQAIMKGLLKAGLYQPSDIYVYDVYQPTLDQLAAELDIQPVTVAKTLATQTDTLLLAVKPNILPSLLQEIGGSVPVSTLVISIAAGVTQATLTADLSPAHKIVRVMPNTPALVGEGMAALAPNAQVTEADKATASAIFNSFGRAEFVTEHLMDAVCGLSGSAPAFVYIFIEALADAGVLDGLPRPLAYELAAQTVLGSAKMVLETGKHPGELKDMVTSPGGTTITGVQALENNGLRAAVIAAVHAATEKSKELG